MARIWKTETSHSSNQRAETQRLRNKYPMGNPLQSLTCSHTKLNKINNYLYFDQICFKSLLFAKLHNIWNMQIYELLLVATGTPVWEACVCLTCKYFPALYAFPTVSDCVLQFSICDTVTYWLNVPVSSQFCVWQCHKSSSCTYNAICTSFYALVSYVQIFV